MHDQEENRLKAIAELKASPQFKSMPALLYALTDPSLEVAEKALTTIESISGFETPPEVFSGSCRQMSDFRRIREFWKGWYDHNINTEPPSVESDRSFNSDNLSRPLSASPQ